MPRRPTLPRVGASGLYDPAPRPRLEAATQLRPRQARKLQARAEPWPDLSPGAVNAWALLVTTKPPAWRDDITIWRELPLAVGELHEGFLYPDPLGFWAEIRRWAVTIFRAIEPDWATAEALSLTTALHVGDDQARLKRALDVCRPRLVLFLDEPGWQAAALQPTRSDSYHVPDPHRAGQVYQGLWGVLSDGTIVGKAPQHPTMHRFYRPTDMDRFLDGWTRFAGNGAH